MGKVSQNSRTYLREAVTLADRVIARPYDKDMAFKLAVKVLALEEALLHGGFKHR